MTGHNKQLWTPAEIYSPFLSIGASLPHMHTRIKKGLISPSVKGKGQGSKQLYDSSTALLYAVATYLEHYGYSIEVAYTVALDAVTRWFTPCNRGTAWMVEFNNNSKLTVFLDNIYKSNAIEDISDENREFLQTMSPGLDLEQSSYIVFEPYVCVKLPIHKNILSSLEKDYGPIRAVRYIYIAEIVRECVLKLKVDISEIAILEKLSHILQVRELKKIY